MRITFRHNFLLLAFAPLLWSCATDDVTAGDPEDKTEEVIEEGAFMTLQIERPGDARPFKSPHGGQYGDAVVSGNQWSPDLKDLTYDYALEDICIFLFDTNGQTVKEFLNTGSSSAAPVLSKYITKFVAPDPDAPNDFHDGTPYDKQYATATIALGSITTAQLRNLKMVVVGNTGNITGECKTLGDLRDRIANTGYIGEDRTHVAVICPGYGHNDGKVLATPDYPYYFTMGLYDEPSAWFFDGKKGDKDDPYVASVTLERISARIDFKLPDIRAGKGPTTLSQVKDPYAPIPYPVEVGGETLAKNWVTHIRLVNAVQKPSYYFRRTAANPTAASGEQDILGFETMNNQISTNYIIDPLTADKAAAPSNYYGTTALKDVKDIDFKPEERVISRRAFMSQDIQTDCLPEDRGMENLTSMAFDHQSNNELERENYYILGYPQENTLAPGQMTRDYTTGILVRSLYEPKKVWRLKGAVTDPNATIEAENPGLTDGLLSNCTTPDGKPVGEHLGCTFWMIEALVPNPTEADRAYFMAVTTTGMSADEAKAALAAPTTEADKEKIMRAVEIFKSEHPESGWTDPVEYVGGVAYNYYWVRHSNSQGTGHPFNKMEYSIVRNNIYRIGITAFSGPGAPSTDPDLDNPDRILPVTYVHKWHRYEVEEVNM